MSQLAEMLRQGASFSGQERNCVYLNLGDRKEARGRFACISAASGFDYPDDARAIAAVDWDLDGDVDLWVTNRTAPQVRFMRNNCRSENRFLAVRLQGNGSSTNRDGIGARVEVVLKQNLEEQGTQHRLVQTLRAGEGYLGQSSKWLHFGLGTDGQIAQVIVQWPGGEEEVFSGAEHDRHCELVQGTGRAHLLPRRSQELAIAQGEQMVAKTPSEGRIRLVTPVHVPSVSVEQLDGSIRALPVRGGQARVILLWATWCAPCMAEIKELIDHQEELKAAGIEILAISVDGMKSEGTSLVDVRLAAERLNMPFFVGRATPQLLEVLYGIRDTLLAFSRDPQIPSSFLLDGQGRLLAIYTGPVSVQTLMDDASAQGGDVVQRFLQAAPIPGRVVEHEAIVDAMLENEAWVHNLVALKLSQLNPHDLSQEVMQEFEAGIKAKPESIHLRLQAAKILLQRDRLAQARKLSEDILHIDPSHAEAHTLLGNIALAERNLPAAERHFLKAVRIDPQQATALHNLGNIFDAQHDVARAAEYFRKAIDADSYSLASYVSLALNYYRQQKTDEALALLQKVVSIAPDYVDAYANWGSILLAQGKLTEAQPVFERAAALAPDNAMILFSLGEVAYQQHQPDQATKFFQRSLRLAEAQGLGDIARSSTMRLRQLAAAPR
ncbi:MAG TPA: tetratricopeptide repeat protein [Pirellulaceae bacterium]|nr:tetratricopeptide repeat protein [Pirellulaceae bacterium]